jgi:predicted nicotinamide N-methyase
VKAEELSIPLGPDLPSIVVLRPIEQEALLRAAIEKGKQEHLPDGGTPYFAELWPAAVPLARFLIASRIGEGERVLELGCGLGFVGIALARVLGARVTLTDGSPTALELASRAIALNGPFEHDPVVVRLDWREPVVESRFPIVIGADVLYEPESFPALAKAARACVAPGGSVFLAEPRRPVAKSARAFLEGEGLTLVGTKLAENGVLVQEWRIATSRSDETPLRGPELAG